MAKEQPNGIPVAIDPLDESIKAELEALKNPHSLKYSPSNS
ncbi:hypothetical protein I5G39_035580 (plasmid) [Pseudomonas aeruginosa]